LTKASGGIEFYKKIDKLEGNRNVKTYNWIYENIVKHGFVVRFSIFDAFE